MHATHNGYRPWSFTAGPGKCRDRAPLAARVQLASCPREGQKKEVKTMNYTKPEVVVGGSALSAIQGHPKPTGSAYDAPIEVYNNTVPAYEADE